MPEVARREFCFAGTVLNRLLDNEGTAGNWVAASDETWQCSTFQSSLVVWDDVLQDTAELPTRKRGSRYQVE